MIHRSSLVALGALSAALVACGSSIEPPDPLGPAGAAGSSAGSAGSGAGTTSAGSGGTSSAGAGSGGTSAGTAGSAGTVGSQACVPGVPSSSQIPRMRQRQYDAVMKHLLDVTSVASAPGGNPASFLVDDFEGALTDIAWNGYVKAADAIAAEVMGGPNRQNFITCDPAAPNCIADTIRTFGRKAFRRPLTEKEEASFARLSALAPPATPDQVAEAVLYTFLASPSFIMIPELAQEQDPSGAGIKLNGYEVAARLSFFLWNSIPDHDLDTAADANALQTPAQILEQAKRMVLDRAKTAPAVLAFHRSYADIRNGSHWDSIDHNPTTYPLFTPTLRPSMMAEIDAFFEEVAFQNGGFKDLFLSNVGFVNKDTAAVYGLDPTQFGTELKRVDLDANQRPGFLTRVGFLSSYSSYDTTSPLLRGAYLARNILDIHIDDPPEDAADTPIPEGEYDTYRQMMEALTKAPKCASCHAGMINPGGFVLEHYDSVGAWQDTDRLGGAIDGSADVMFSEDNIKPITSPLELMTELGKGAEAKHRYAELWVSFATGRVANQNDACQVNALDLKLSEDGYRILDLLTDLTQADSFRLRTVGN